MLAIRVFLLLASVAQVADLRSVHHELIASRHLALLFASALQMVDYIVNRKAARVRLSYEMIG